MLSTIKNAETIEIPYAGIVPAAPVVTFNLDPGIPYNLSHIRSTITSGAVLVLPSWNINDETGTQILFISIIPWLFPATTISTTVAQSPNVALTSFFAPAIGGFIPADFHVFNGWTITFFDFIPTPGVAIEAIISVNRSWQQMDRAA